MVQRVQHLLFLCGLGLLSRQRFPCPAVHCVQSNHIAATQTRNRARDYGLAPCSLAEVLRDIRRETLVRRPPHQPQGRPHLLVGKNIQKRRLLEIGRQALFECVVEDCIAR